MSHPMMPLVVMPHEGHATPGPGDLSTIKIPAIATSGQLLLREYRFEPCVGPPLHRHAHEDEIFWVLEGNVMFIIDGVRSAAEPGAYVLAPRGKPHAFKNTGVCLARLIAIVMPGPNFESFCNDFAAVMSGQETQQEKILLAVEVSTRHGIEISDPTRFD